MIIVASVPHTGSHFAVETIDVPMGTWDAGGVGKMNLYHVYQGEGLRTIKDAHARGALLVVPLRHPMAAAQSWANRGKPISEHPVHEPMVKLWRNMIDHVAPLGPMYLPVDVPDRDRYLKAIGERVGKELETDWQKRGHHDIQPETLHPDDIAAVHELLKDPFFQEFGYA